MSHVLHDVLVISLDVRIWSGRKKLKPEDLTASGKLPPKELVSLGSKRIFDPKALQPFGELKRRAESRCQAVGVRFARAFAIPKIAAKSVIEELNTLAQRFDEKRAAFLATYEAELTRWKGEHPGYERLIEAELLPRTVVGSKLAFGYHVFAINAIEDDAELSGLMEQGGAGNLTTGLVGALYDEIAGASRDFVRQSLLGRDQVTQKFLRPVRAIRDKLAGLAFLDATIAPLVGSIDEVLLNTPAKGAIDGASLAALRGVVMLLTDPTRMREHGRLIVEGSSKGLLEAVVTVKQEAELELATVDQEERHPADHGVEVPESRTQRVSAFW